MRRQHVVEVRGEGEPAGVDQHQVVADALEVADQMAGEDDGEVAFGDGFGQHAQKVPAGQGIQRCHGFVEQQQPRPLAQRHGKRDLRPLATR